MNKLRLTRKVMKTVAKAPPHPVKSAVKIVVCGLAIFAFIKMLPEVRRYIRIEMM